MPSYVFELVGLKQLPIDAWVHQPRLWHAREPDTDVGFPDSV